MYRYFPVIDPDATGKNIIALRKARGLTVKDIQQFFGFEEPQAVYKWQQGKSLPTVDNLLALSVLLGVTIEQILVCKNNKEQQAETCCSVFLWIRLCAVRQKSNDMSINFCALPGVEPRFLPVQNTGHNLNKNTRLLVKAPILLMERYGQMSQNRNHAKSCW